MWYTQSRRYGARVKFTDHKKFMLNNGATLDMDGRRFIRVSFDSDHRIVILEPTDVPSSESLKISYAKRSQAIVSCNGFIDGWRIQTGVYFDLVRDGDLFSAFVGQPV